MINAQNWLEQNYSNKEKTTYINANNENLVGQLIIQDFPNLEKIECRNNKNLTSIELNSLPQLNSFNANNCQITEIKINNCSEINYLNVANNLLTELNFLTGLNNPKKLVTLSIHSNNFSEQGLDFFSRFINLEQLFLDNCDEEKFGKDIYNKFFGSLQPLQNLVKLELLSIGNTNIDSGLGYLPKNFRKIGLNTSWWEADYGSCSKLRQELEKVVQLKGITENLKSEQEKNSQGKKDEPWFSDYYRIAPWRQAKELEKKLSGQNAQEWLNKNYPKAKRAAVIFLNINGKNLEGDLKLEVFINLKKLDCSFNQLTNLDLGDCPNLTYLNCSWNKFPNTNFLKTISNKEKLETLKINNNEDCKENLNFLVSFKELHTLNIENCPFYGSLEPLKNTQNLKKIFVTNTDISEGLKHLPDSCKEFYCNTSEYKYKSIEIVKELAKYLEEKYYNVSQWKMDKHNSMIASVIPLERLYVIRNNLKQFLKKWGTEKDRNNQNELSKLKSPEELNQERKWKIYLPQFVGRGLAVAGAVLTFQDYSAAGGGILGVYPFAELGISKLEKDFEDKKNKWKEFLTDADTFLDNYHELLGILVPFEIDDLKIGGTVNETLKNLKIKIEEFLEDYDKDDNREIDIEELKGKREKFARELSEENNRVREIIDAIERLERAITEHRRTSYGIGEKDIKEKAQLELEIQPTVSGVISDELEEKDLKSLEEQKLEILEKIKKLELTLKDCREKDKESKVVKLKNEIDDLKVELVVREARIELNKEKEKELETQLKEEQIKFQQIKKELIEKQNNLILLKKKEKLITDDKELSESVEILEKKIDELKQELSKIEKKITGISFLLFETQIKELWNMNWGGKVSHGWEAICDVTKYCATGTWNCLVAPAWYWEQWKNRKELLINDNKKNEGEENRISGKESESNMNNAQQSETEQVIDLDEHFAQKKEIQTGLKRRKSISQMQDRKLSNKKIELVELQIQEEQQTETSSSEYNSGIQIPPK